MKLCLCLIKKNCNHRLHNPWLPFRFWLKGIEMKSINIIVGGNGLGLSRDVEILSATLQAAGFTVAVNGILKATGGRLRKLPYDINLLLEHIFPHALPFARVNCLIPNPEWFRDECQPHLAAMDWVLCKTRHAQTIFQNLGCKTEFISFSSLDQ